MRKHIGTKIIAFLLILFVVFEGTCLVTLTSTNNISKEMERLSNIYLELQTQYTELGRNMENIKNFANLIALLPIKEATDGMAAQSGDFIAALNANIENMKELCEQSGDTALTEAFANYSATLTPVNDVLLTVVELYYAGETEATLGVALSLNEAVYAITEAENVFLECLDNGKLQCQEATAQAVAISKLITVAAMLLFVVVMIFVVIVVLKTIANPAKKATKQLNSIIDKIQDNEGDLTDRIAVKSSDEVGQLVKGVNNFMAQLQNVMQTIQINSNSLNESASSIYDHIIESNQNATSISDTIEELAASMEEVSATVDTINSNSKELFDETKVIANEAYEGTGFVSEIKDRAQQVREETVASKETTSIMINNIKEVLESSIQESKSVEKIEELTKDILEISSQTNLLALNASIEAARAGEAGKGFAVVADEIRKLADSSRDTANNIQTISIAVTRSVEDLAQNANEMIQFINSDILTDYEKFVDIADQYHADADSVDKILFNFSEGAKKLSATMKDVTNAIHEIAVTVDESAKGISNAAENASLFVDTTQDIQKEVDSNRTIASTLQEEVNRFKKI